MNEILKVENVFNVINLKILSSINSTAINKHEQTSNNIKNKSRQNLKNKNKVVIPFNFHHILNPLLLLLGCPSKFFLTSLLAISFQHFCKLKFCMSFLSKMSLCTHFCQGFKFRIHGLNCLGLHYIERKILSRNYNSVSSPKIFEPNSINDYDSKPLFDVVIVGGGIIGVTTARAMLIEKPSLKVALLEKENNVAVHQSGHNSGVIHAGIYYKSRSLKARFCVAGLHATYAFCDKHNVPYRKCGKLIVATEEPELYYLKKLHRQGLDNNSPDIELVNEKQIREIEPHCKGLKAIYSPNTGIIDWGLFTKYCARDFQKLGGVIFCNFEVCKIEEATEGTAEVDVSQTPLELHDAKNGHIIRSKYAIICGGLYSDRLAKLCHSPIEPVIIPFRGEYLELVDDKRHLVKGNIYPVPDPRFPFLGVHFTPRLDGNIWLGPNAILALGREGYSWKHINKKDLLEMFMFPGFRKLMKQYGSYGVKEFVKSFFISLRIKELQKYIPEIRKEDIVFKGATGVRAQALDDTGLLVDDLVLQLGSDGIEARILQVRNAPSPAATSSLALSEYIAKSANVEFEY